ncbi:hypothetical protein ABIG06_003105 [Bradyrhizobium sp. USDA 326]|uniref:hypothetical protein n=1 Tax=unclassified Bradyrhizobium TaxID=2631580 RepID=UPI000F51DABD|nr:hypothetical protein [Bradyrhizobium sp. RP6]RQH11246.1 hypothetical protein EHH60_20825 [Bradyrhizobium sp. RP6]
MNIYGAAFDLEAAPQSRPNKKRVTALRHPNGPVFLTRWVARPSTASSQLRSFGTRRGMPVSARPCARQQGKSHEANAAGSNMFRLLRRASFWNDLEIR